MIRTALLSLCFLSSAFAGNSTLESAQQAFLDQEYSIAETLYRANYINCAKEEKSQALYFWNNALLRAQDFKSLIANTETFQKQETISLQLELQLAQAYLHSGQAERVLLLQQISKTQKDSPLRQACLKVLADAHIQQKNYAKALSLYQDPLLQENHSLTLIELHLAAKNYELARQLLSQEADNDHKVFLQFWLDSQDSPLQQGITSFAAVQKRGLKSDICPYFSPVLHQWLKILSTHNNGDAVAKLRQFLLTEDPTLARFTLFAEAEKLLTDKKQGQAITLWQTINEQSPRQDFKIRALLKLARHDNSSSETYFKQALELAANKDSVKVNVLQQRAWQYRKAAQLQEAYQDFLQAAELSIEAKHKQQFYELAGDTFFDAKQQLPLAIQAYEQALQIEKTDSLLYRYALCQWENQNYPAAQQAFRLTLKQSKDDSLDAKFYLAFCLIKNKAFNQGYQDIKTLVRKTPDHPKVPLALRYILRDGLERKDNKRLVDSIQFSKKILAKNKDITTVQDLLLYAQAQLEHSSQAWKHFIQSFPKSPLLARAYFRLADKQVKEQQLGSLKKASALQEQSSFFPSLILRAKKLYQQEKFLQADSLLRAQKEGQITRTAEEALQYHLLLTDIAQKLGQSETAILEIYLALKACTEKNTVYYDLLGRQADILYALAFKDEQANDKLQKAAELYAQCTENHPQNAMQSLYKEAKVYEKLYQQNKKVIFRDKAILKYREALKRKLRYAQDRYYFAKASYDLGQTYLRLKRYNSAQAVYKNLAAKNFPGTQDAKEIAEHIQKRYLN